MAQTPLQELIEYMENHSMENTGTYKKAQSLLLKDRQIIEDAYSDGKYHSTQGTITEIDMTASEYFTQNFNQ